MKEEIKEDIRNLEYLSKGKRSKVYSGIIKNKKIVVKVGNKIARENERIKNEIYFLKILNKKGIGPKLFFYSKNYFIMERIEGELILDYFEKNPRGKILKVVEKIIEKCYLMDKLGINKLEFTRPIKHVIVVKNEPRIIDFERCYYTKKPKNITQFCHFLISKRVEIMFIRKGIIIDKKLFIETLRNYKKEMNRRKIGIILKLIQERVKYLDYNNNNYLLNTFLEVICCLGFGLHR